MPVLSTFVAAAAFIARPLLVRAVRLRRGLSAHVPFAVIAAGAFTGGALAYAVSQLPASAAAPANSPASVLLFPLTIPWPALLPR